MFLSRLNPLRSAQAPSQVTRRPRRGRKTLAATRRPRRNSLRLEALERRDLLSTGVVVGWGGSADERAAALVADPQGNTYVAGSFSGTVDFDPGPGQTTFTSVENSRDVFVAKYLSDGTLGWAQCMGGAGDDSGAYVAVDSQGRTWVSGSFQQTAYFGELSLTTLANSSDMFVARLDAYGEVDMALQIASPTVGEFSNSGSVTGIAVDSDNNVLLAGLFLGTVDFDPDPNAAYNLTALGWDARDAFVMKLDPNGAFVWADRMGGSSNVDSTEDVAVDLDGNVYVTGRFHGTADFGPFTLAGGNGDMFVSKLTSDGAFTWARMMDAEQDVHPSGIAVDNYGNAYTTGLYLQTTDFDPGPGTALLPDSGVFVSSLDASGNYRWAHQIGSGGNYNEWGLAVKVGPDGNVYVAGREREGDFDPGIGSAYFTGAGDLDAFVAEFDTAAGDFRGLWHMGGTGWDEAAGLALHQNAVTGTVDVLLAGRYSGTARFDDGNGYVDMTSAGGTDAYLLRLTQEKGAILGRVHIDLGPEGVQPAVAQTVYLDQNSNGVLDDEETSTISGPQGEYAFRHLGPGDYTIALVLPEGWNQVSPPGNSEHLVNLASGQFITDAAFAVTVPTATVTVTTNTPLSIPTKGTVRSTLTTTDARTLLDINVKLNISHKADDHLDVYLIAPDGTRVQLTTDNGGAGDHYSDTVFSDEAGTPVTAGSAPFRGTYRPEGLLASLDGKSFGGTWTLEITDDTPGTGGKLNNWSLTAMMWASGSLASTAAASDTFVLNEETSIALAPSTANRTHSGADSDTVPGASTEESLLRGSLDRAVAAAPAPEESFAFAAEASESTGDDWGFSIGPLPGQSLTVIDSFVDADGNPLAVGNFSGTVDFDPFHDTPGDTMTGAGTFAALYQPDGTLAWVRHLIVGAEIGAAATDSAGNLYLTGEVYQAAQFGSLTRAGFDGADAYVAKYDAALDDFAWAVVIPSPSELRAIDVAPDASGDVYVTGWFGLTTTFGGITLTAFSAGSDAFLVKFDGQTGSPLWAWQGKGPAVSEGSVVLARDDNAIYVAGQFGDRGHHTVTLGAISLTARGDEDVYVAKIDATTGSEQWVRRMGGDFTDYSSLQGDFVLNMALAQDGSQSLHVLGCFSNQADFGTHSVTSAGSADLFVTKLNPEGEFLWAVALPEGNSLRNAAPPDGNFPYRGIACSPQGEVYIASAFRTGLGDFDPGPRAVYATCTQALQGYVLRLDAGGHYDRVWLMGNQGADVTSSATQVVVGEGGAVYVRGKVRGTVDVFGTTLTTVSPDKAENFFRKLIPQDPAYTVPVAIGEAYTCQAYYGLSVASAQGVLVNDTDADRDSLGAFLVTAPAHGTLVMEQGGGFRYTPFGDFTGVDTFTYKANDGTADSTEATVSITVESLHSVSYASTDVPKALYDLWTVRSTLAIADPFVIGDINVTLTIAHPRCADMDVFLIAPDGTRVELFTDVGKGANFTNTTLDDAASKSITQGSSPFAGTFRPEGNLTGLEGKLATGTWTLEVTDDAKSKTGTLQSWSLIVTPAEPDGGAALAATDAVLGASSPTAPGSNALIDAFWASTSPKSRSRAAVDSLMASSADDLLARGVI